MTTRAKQMQKRALIDFIDTAGALESDFTIQSIRGQLPVEWDYMERLAPIEPDKVQITIRLDEDVVKYFRDLGAGYQNRINMVLRTFVMGRMARVIKAREDGKEIHDLL